MQKTDDLTLSSPSLPKGGGALTGLSGQLGPTGPDGAAGLSVPLPITPGRGYAPSLSLQYNSQAGNGPFGMGWSVSTLSVRRSTRTGVPRYSQEDTFLGPYGEILVPATDGLGEPEILTRNTLLATRLDTPHHVSIWRSAVESDFSRLEYWQPSSGGMDFWVLYQPDGQVHLLGGEVSSRLCDPTEESRTAVWLLSASVSASGEQIAYRWRGEDEVGCDAEEKRAHPDATAQRYLSEVHYGNMTPGRAFPCLNDRAALTEDGLFVLVFDYGERSLTLNEPPAFAPHQAWPCRQDGFSGYEYGFELRTRRLCRQVLMFHRIGTLAKGADGDHTPVLVSRLLMEYRESPFVSVLSAVRQMAFDNDATASPLMLPPLSFEWQEFQVPNVVEWQTVDRGNLNTQQPWQSVDLWGEGLAGLLYQDAGAWWYRAPIRDSGSHDINAVALDIARPLPGIPSLRRGAMLTDLNGDGRLQWLVSVAGVNGHYKQDSDNPGQWLRFTPLSALPVEYTHPQAQLADLTGRGFTDLVLIGPRSVRVYTGQGDGWAKGQTVLQSGGITLPIPGANPNTLVAFSDPLGSGQQHLMQIRADGVTCWPNLGHGRFGQPLVLPGFSQPAQRFEPDQVFLADIDGSGTVDVIYAHADRLEIYRNQSGNRFSPPFSISLPKGVRYDRTCQLQVSDILGLGTGSLLLTVPHPVPRHYVFSFTAEKPWLLRSTCNNMGAHQTLHYRSSAQFWLDEKAEAHAQGKPSPACYLPFPLHLLCKTVSEDEITGNRLVSENRYRHGAWDGRLREFRGFGYTETRDMETLASEVYRDVAPSLTRSWYATGLRAVDEALSAEFWRGDEQAYPLFQSRFTFGNGEEESPCPDSLQASCAFWLYRAMKGQLLRREVYGMDGSERQDIPYEVTEQRVQVRLINPSSDTPVVWPSVVESRHYQYERVVQDPQCSQTITQASDAYGTPLREVNISYPRRPKRSVSPYPDTLPASLYASSYDAQQQWMRLTVTQRNWHHLTEAEKGIWLAALPVAERRDVLRFGLDSMPLGGVSLETLGSLLSEAMDNSFAGQQQTYWLDSNHQPTVTCPAFPPREAFTETAELDESRVQALSGVDTAVLISAGYHQTEYLFAREEEKEHRLWSIRTGGTEFGGENQFWRPLAYRDTPLSGKNTLAWDRHFLVVLQHSDAAGLRTRAEYDWRFLSPNRLYDGNDNCHQVVLDALGRVSHSRFSGTENAVLTGYSDAVFTVPADADSALSASAPLPVAQCFVYVADSWMKTGAEKMPPHVIMLTSDRYDNDPAQQIRQQVVFSDGLGRLLQTGIRSAAGKAWVWSQGALANNGDGTPLMQETAFRWCISGRTEYDSKGQPVRVYQPYFLNTWKYVEDDSLRQDANADTHYYDPLGREYRVITAKGYCRCSMFTPWFVVSEDENDTLTS